MFPKKLSIIKASGRNFITCLSLLAAFFSQGEEVLDRHVLAPMNQFVTKAELYQTAQGKILRLFQIYQKVGENQKFENIREVEELEALVHEFQTIYIPFLESELDASIESQVQKVVDYAEHMVETAHPEWARNDIVELVYKHYQAQLLPEYKAKEKTKMEERYRKTLTPLKEELAFLQAILEKHRHFPAARLHGLNKDKTLFSRNRYDFSFPEEVVPIPKKMDASEWVWASEKTISNNKDSDDRRYFLYPMTRDPLEGLLSKSANLGILMKNRFQGCSQYFRDLWEEPKNLHEFGNVNLSYSGPGCHRSPEPRGFIVSVPYKNIIATRTTRRPAIFEFLSQQEASGLRGRFPIMNPDDLLDHTPDDAEESNHVSVLGTDEATGAKVEVLGVYYVTDPKGKPYITEEEIHSLKQYTIDHGFPEPVVLQDGNDLLHEMAKRRKDWQVSRFIADSRLQSPAQTLFEWIPVVREWLKQNRSHPIVKSYELSQYGQSFDLLEMDKFIILFFNHLEIEPLHDKSGKNTLVLKGERPYAVLQKGLTNHEAIGGSKVKARLSLAASP